MTAPMGLCGSPVRAATLAASASMGVSTATTPSTGPAWEISRAALRSGSRGSARSTGRPPSGSAPSLPTTTVSPIRRAAARKSPARYVCAGMSSSTRAPAISVALTACGAGTVSRRSPFRRCEEGGGPGFVVGDVDQAHHVRDAGPEQRLDALPERHLGQAASLAAALQADPHPALVDPGQDDTPAVGRDRGVDLRVQDSANPVGETAGGGRRQLATRSDHPDPGDLRNRRADQRLHAGGQRKGRPRGPAGFEGDHTILNAGHPQAAAACDHRRQHAALNHGPHPGGKIGHGTVPPPSAVAGGPAGPLTVATEPSAASRSATRSRGSSMPMDRRSRSPVTGDDGPSVLWRCSMRLSTPPREVARLNTRTDASTALARSGPPATRIDSIPPNPPPIWRAATAWPGCEASPGYSTTVKAGCPSKCRAMARALSEARRTRRNTVRIPRCSSQASNGPGTAPALRRHERIRSQNGPGRAVSTAPARTSPWPFRYLVAE